MASNILQFDPTRLITAINIVDDMLFYSDGVTEPKKINIKKFRGGNTTGEFANVKVDHSSGTTHIYGRPFEERDITVIKDHAGISAKKLSTTVITENFGIGRDDLTVNEITVKELEITSAETGVKEENPAKGKVELNFNSTSLDLVEMEGKAIFGGGSLVDGGFIYSQTDSTLEDLIKNQGVTSTKITGDYVIDDGSASSIFKIEGVDTNSPNYRSSLTTGKLCAVAFIKLRGQDEIIYSPVKTINVFNQVASSTAPTGLVTQPEKKINQTDYEFSARYLSNGGSPITRAGFYVAEGRLNDNDPAPTVQEIIDNGHNFPAENRDPNQIFITKSPKPNHFYYYVPYLENKNGIVYGDALTTSSSAIQKFKSQTTLPFTVFTTSPIDPANANTLVITGNTYGNIRNRKILHPKAEVTEVGIYFRNSPDYMLRQDVIKGPFSDNSPTFGSKNASGTFKITIVSSVGSSANLMNPNAFTSFNFEKGGQFTLDVASYLPGNLAEGEQIAWAAYIKHTGFAGSNETIGGLNFYKIPVNTTDDPVLAITSSKWHTKANSTSNEGIKDIEINYNLDLTKFDDTKTLEDIGIIVSKPFTAQEIANSKDGKWDTVDEVINSSNSTSIQISKDSLTFSPHAGSNNKGRYATTNPIEIPSLTYDEFNYMSNNNVKPLGENWSAVGYVVIDMGGVLGLQTHYTDVFNIDSDASNIDVKDKVIKNIIGAPIVLNKNSLEQSVTNITSSGVTLNASINNTGKDIAEIGFYVSTVKPPAAAISGDAISIPRSLADSRNPDLDAWIAGATKYASTDVNTTTANNHINQSTNNFLDFKSVITGLNAKSKYYYVPYVKPVQTTNIGGDVSYNGSETLNDIINSNHYGSLQSFDTAQNITNFFQAPAVVVLDVELISKIEADVDIELTFRSDSANTTITDLGIFVKKASLFPQPFSNQSGNASTMASATNRIRVDTSDYYGVNTAGINLSMAETISHRTHGRRKTTHRTVKNIEQVDYYVSAFVEYSYNGNSHTIISDYKLINNSINANIPVPEITYFDIIPPDTSGFILNPVAPEEQASARSKNRVKAEFTYERKPIPQIIEYGFYFLENSSLSKPSSPDNFLTQYNDSSNAWNKHNVKNYSQLSPVGKDSLGTSGSYTNYLPFFENFPSAVVGKRFYILPYFTYKFDNSDPIKTQLGDQVQEFYMEDPAPVVEAIIEADNDAIYWSPHAPPGALAGIFKNGSPAGAFVHADVRRRAIANLYRPPFVQVNITSNVEWQYRTVSTNYGRSFIMAGTQTGSFYGAGGYDNRLLSTDVDGGGDVYKYGGSGPDQATLTRSSNALRIYPPRAAINTITGAAEWPGGFINDQLPWNGSKSIIEGGYNIYILPASIDLKKFALSTNPRNFANFPTALYVTRGILEANALQVIEVRYDTSGILSYPND
tara:strand:+ start:1749 stop:6014 length:4266 start_codon:yes stop_codon:yes gene_type:complete